MRSIKPAVAALIVSAVLAVGTGVAAPQESLDGEQSYVLTFDDGSDVDAVLVDLEQQLDVTITHRFGTVVPGAVVTTSEVPEAMVMLPGVATVDRNAIVQLDPIESTGPDDPADPTEGSDDTPSQPTPMLATLMAAIRMLATLMLGDPDAGDPDRPSLIRPSPRTLRRGVWTVSISERCRSRATTPRRPPARASPSTWSTRGCRRTASSTAGSPRVSTW